LSDEGTDKMLDEPSLPLTRATLHRANTLPNLVPQPLWWMQGGPRAAWGWHAPDGRPSVGEASRDSGAPSTPAHGPRSTLASSAEVQRHVSHGRSGLLDSASSVRDSAGDSDVALSHRGQDSARSLKPTPWEAQRIRELMRKPSSSAWDLGWGPEAAGTTQVPTDLGLPPPVQPKQEAATPRSVHRPQLRRAMSALLAEQALEYYDCRPSSRRHRFSRALRLAIEARQSWRDTHANATADRATSNMSLGPTHASPAQLVAPRVPTRRLAQHPQAQSQLWAMVRNWLLPNGLSHKSRRTARRATGNGSMGTRGAEGVRI